MKRKEYRQRQPVTLSVEKDRWKDFEDLCDKERKSISLKVAEMLEEELQKNALGVAREPNPLNIHTYVHPQEKPLQTGLDRWIKRTDAIQEIQRVDNPEMYEHIGINMIVASRFQRSGIVREVKVL